MLETHPFGVFVPAKARYLILGSFTGQQSHDWFYGTRRNQFWPILREVYGRELVGRVSKEKLFEELGVAIGDIIYQCERVHGSNLDTNLVNIVYNFDPIENILARNKIARIYFSSRFVETIFKRHFKDIIGRYRGIELVTLPSPSPRYAAISKEEKARRYVDLLPKLG